MKQLFLDLDNTIFPPRSIPPETIRKFYSFIAELATEVNKEREIHFYNDFISLSFPELLKKFGIPKEYFKEEYAKRDFFNEKADISPYPDYEEIRKLKNTKYLVTTGFTDLQWLKIKNLGIKTDLRDIVIDDPIYNPIGKTKAFESLIEKYNIDKSTILVIGDNPESEIKSGMEIGLKTVLIDRKGKYNGQKTYADWVISDFSELPSLEILK